MPTTAEIIEDVRKSRADAYEVHSSGLIYYVSRGLHDPLSAEGKGESYPTYLPTHKGKSFREIMEDLVSASETVDLLDVGCGDGTFLVNVAQEWKGKVAAYGITSFNYTHILLDEDDILNKSETFRRFEEGEEIRKHVHKQVGDVNDLVKLYGHNRFDVVTSVQTTKYLADPWMTLKEIYDVLKPGGIALIDYFYPTLNNGTPKQDKTVTDYLRENYGMEIETNNDGIQTLSFAKSKNKLQVPVHYAKTGFNRILPLTSMGLIDQVYYAMLYEPCPKVLGLSPLQKIKRALNLLIF